MQLIGRICEVISHNHADAYNYCVRHVTCRQNIPSQLHDRGGAVPRTIAPKASHAGDDSQRKANYDTVGHHTPACVLGAT